MSKKRKLSENSLLAYWEGHQGEFSDRELQILEFLKWAHGKQGYSDREICLALNYTDMNAVRPRLTELCDHGVLEKVGNQIDPITRKRVRLLALRNDPRRPQREFSFVLEKAGT